MNWRRLFREIILERGRIYYQRNQVRGLSYDNFIYKAKVQGELTYNVEVKMRDDDIIYMKCSCPYAVEGHYCKHMAAVMFAIEDSGAKVRKVSSMGQARLIQPFTEVTERYQYFDVGRITKGMKFREGTYQESKRLIEEQLITLEGVEVGYHRFVGGVILCGVAHGYYEHDGTRKQINIINRSWKLEQRKQTILS